MFLTFFVVLNIVKDGKQGRELRVLPIRLTSNYGVSVNAPTCLMRVLPIRNGCYSFVKSL